jgi:hypothetical protein
MNARRGVIRKKREVGRAMSADTRGMSRADALLYAQKQREFAGEEGRVEREAFAQAAHTRKTCTLRH